ncbi:MAG: hypothetical protein CMH49_00355 [Myxococcales bacterium]|nr:hypothetical protein [Myxococcales bacterium]
MDYLLQSIELHPKEISFKILEQKLGHTLQKTQIKVFREIKALVDEQKIYQAYSHLKNDLSYSRKDEFIHYLAGRIALVCGDFALAQSHLSQAYFHVSKHSELSKQCLISLAKNFIQSRSFGRCQALLIEQKRQNSCFELQAITGFLYQSKRKFSAAIKAYEQALELKKTADLVRLSLIKLLIHQQQFKEAQKELDYLHQRAVKSADLWALDAIVHLQFKRVKQSLRSIKKALRVDNKHSLSLLLLGDHYLETKPTLALKYYQASLENKKDFFVVYKRLAEALTIETRYEEAIAQLLMYRCFVSENEHVEVQKNISLLHIKQQKLESVADSQSKSAWWKLF